MHTTIRTITAAAACALLLAAGAAAGQGGTAQSTVLDVMLGTTGPASDVIFEAQSEVPTTDEGWRAVQAAAERLAESGRLLQRAPLARPEAEWNEMAEALVREAARAGTLAGKHDGDALVDAGDAVYFTCETCHKRFVGGAR